MFESKYRNNWIKFFSSILFIFAGLWIADELGNILAFIPLELLIFSGGLIYGFNSLDEIRKAEDSYKPLYLGVFIFLCIFLAIVAVDMVLL